jgi:hypothetical protein
MPVRVTYIDTATSEVLEGFEVSDTALKVLSTDMISPEHPKVIFADWHKNAIVEKIRREQDNLCADALGNGSEKVQPLTSAQRQQVVAELASLGIVVSSVKEMPAAVKDRIIELATIRTAAERQAEFEAGLP